MPDHFLYDTHYQLDKPFALIDVTLAAASPSQSAADHVLARRLEERATSRRVRYRGISSEWVTSDEPWKINKDAFIYWIGNCQHASLLSRQNAYDFWLVNFSWAQCFNEQGDAWGTIAPSKARFSQLLLFRWAWLHDGPMLAAILRYLAREGPKDKQALYEDGSRAAEETIIAVLSALRETTQDIRLKTQHRRQIERLQKEGFKYNTRRHKLATHLSILLESGVIQYTPLGFQINDAVWSVFAAYHSVTDAARDALRPSTIGAGGDLFLQIVGATFGSNSPGATGLAEKDWIGLLARIRSTFWPRILEWDRKFIGIEELAEFFLVENLERSAELWSIESWKQLLVDRSRRNPEELTIHVGRFGDAKYLRLA